MLPDGFKHRRHRFLSKHRRSQTRGSVKHSILYAKDELISES